MVKATDFKLELRGSRIG